MADICFAGDLTSPFIKDELHLLTEDNQVTTCDFSKEAKSFWQIPSFLVSAYQERNRIKETDLVWLWFADYPAVPFVLLAKYYHKPVVVHIGGYEVYNAPEIKYGNQRKVIRGAISRWIIRNATTCLTPSRAYLKLAQALVPEAHIHVLYNWIDETLLDVELPEKRQQVVTATCKNANFELKGIDTFFECAKYLPAFDYIHLHNVKHEELIKTLQESQVYCQLSRTESFGVTLLEAMACGCCPVFVDNDAMPEIAGDTGARVGYADVPGTLNAIVEAMQMDGQHARDRAKEIMMSRDEYKERVQEVVEECLRR